MFLAYQTVVTVSFTHARNLAWGMPHSKIVDTTYFEDQRQAVRFSLKEHEK
jgi:hypothetical protein